MAFIKRHLMLLSCGLVGFLSIVALAVGILIGDVSAEMRTIESLAQQLKTAGRSPVGEKHLDAAARKGEVITREVAKTDALVKAMNAREPFMTGVFPTPEQDYLRYDFRDAYGPALDALLQTLKAKAPPSEAEIAKMADQLAAQQHQESGRAEFGGGLASPRPDQPWGRPGGDVGGGKAFTGATALEAAAAVQASLVRARGAYCYGSRDSLHVFEQVLSSPPDPVLMWATQLSLWIQQDVVGALARINDAAAAKLAEDRRWVAYLPVKDLVGLAVSDYVFPSQMEGMIVGRDAKGGWAEVNPAQPLATPPPGDAGSVFTGRASGELYDVVHFTVELVVEARSLPIVMDEICAANFFTPLAVAYAEPEVNPAFIGKVYGPDPVIQVVLVYEACFFRELYHPMMPPQVKQSVLDGQPLGVARRAGSRGQGINSPFPG
ncbi:MAG: hypothetical protein JXA69_03075 [Phycisphaerae bacterium]|nr:hypothetical protein [Phycisphaerae bacterium]